MKKLLTLIGVLALAVVARAAGDFTKTLTATELAATGLAKLSPEELAQLKAVVERYKMGEVAVVQQQAATKLAVAEAKVKEAEGKAASAAPEDKAKPGWLRALITLQRTGDKPDKADSFETRIAGKFDGWGGRTTFRLENGQVWQQTSGGEYIGDETLAPKVKIYPGALGTYWMEVDGVNPRVRVKPVKVE